MHPYNVTNESGLVGFLMHVGYIISTNEITLTATDQCSLTVSIISWAYFKAAVSLCCGCVWEAAV